MITSLLRRVEAKWVAIVAVDAAAAVAEEDEEAGKCMEPELDEARCPAFLTAALSVLWKYLASRIGSLKNWTIADY